MSRLNNYLQVALRPVYATQMLWNHRRTMAYMLKKGWFKRLGNFIDVTYLVRGEDCGKGCLDPVWIMNTELIPRYWDIEIEITTRCYLRCVQCEHTYFPLDYKNQDLTLDRFKSVLNSIPNLKWINMTGEGSPFLNKDFIPMLKEAKKKNLYIDFSHDFFLYSDEIGKALIDLGIERIYLSIDGATKETYEKVRINSDFNKVIGNIKKFIELKKKMKSPIPEICFRYAFFKNNVHEISLLPDLLSTLGDIKDLGDEPSINYVGLLEFEQTKGLEVEVSPEVVEQTNKRAKELGFTVYWSHPSHDDSNKPDAHYCMFFSEPYLAIDGALLPCCGTLMSNRRKYLKANSLGNWHEQTIRELWNGEKFKKFRKLIRDPQSPLPSICNKCPTFAIQERIKKYGIWDMEKE